MRVVDNMVSQASRPYNRKNSHSPVDSCGLVRYAKSKWWRCSSQFTPNFAAYLATAKFYWNSPPIHQLGGDKLWYSTSAYQSPHIPPALELTADWGHDQISELQPPHGDISHDQSAALQWSKVIQGKRLNPLGEIINKRYEIMVAIHCLWKLHDTHANTIEWSSHQNRHQWGPYSPPCTSIAGTS